jgi:hypothetical protein
MTTDLAFHPLFEALASKGFMSLAASTIPCIVFALAPTRETEKAEALRLYLDWNVEILNNGISSKWDTTDGPEEHHDRRHSLSRLGPIAAIELGKELNAPTNGADGA